MIARERMLTITSVISVLLFSLHWADEIARGLEPGTFAGGWGGFAILFVWLYATLVVGDRRWGLVLVMLGALLAVGVTLLHMTGHGLTGGRIGPNSDGALLWVWTTVALGSSGMMSLALGVHVWWERAMRRHDR